MMVTNSAFLRYIVMPKEGFENPELKTLMFAQTGRSFSLDARAQATSRPTMRVLSSMSDIGPKLVEMSPEGELSLRLSNPELKVIPEVFYHRQWYRPIVEERPAKRTTRKRKTAAQDVRAANDAVVAPAAGVTISVVDVQTGNPLSGAHVVLFTNFATKAGDQGDSDASGKVQLDAISARQGIDRAYVYGPAGYWGYYATNTTAAALKTIKLAPVDPSDPKLLLRQLYGTLPADAGGGVTVAVIDSGVDGQHPALGNVVGGLNCVTDEVNANPAAASDWGPAQTEGSHGTHVAGIIGGSAGNVFRGVAPGAKIRSYRVFPNAGGGASNFDIAKAINAAVADGCDLINLSLGGGPSDDLTKAAIDRALAAGVVVVAAAGNDSRRPVSYPAAFPECVSITAMGRRSSFPADSIGASAVTAPFGKPNQDDFVADFSNFGPTVDATGPGVEIVSSLPGGKYGPMDGTSMATPAVTGFAAFLLGQNLQGLASRDANRSQKLKNILYNSCKPEGFGREYEGFGLPLPEGGPLIA